MHTSITQILKETQKNIEDNCNEILTTVEENLLKAVKQNTTTERSSESFIKHIIYITIIILVFFLPDDIRGKIKEFLLEWV